MSNAPSVGEVHTVTFTWRPARPGAYEVGRPDGVRAVILHSTCGREAGDLDVLTGHTDRKVSVHWYVNRAGKVYHLVADADTAWHVGKAKRGLGNRETVGIEMEHFDPDEAHPHGEDWPQAQVESVARLCAYLLQRHRLAPSSIHSHAEVALPAGRKVDPVAFPWGAFRALLCRKQAVHWAVEKEA